MNRFSVKRIVVSFLIDWLGTLAMLYAAVLLRVRVGYFPPWLFNLVQRLEIPVGGQGIDWATISPGEIISPHVFVLVAVIWPFFLLLFAVYDGRRQQTLKTELFNVFLVICVSTMTFAGGLYFTYRETPRVIVPIFFLLDVALLLGTRIIWWIYRGARRGRYPEDYRSVIIVGAGVVGRRAVEQLQECAWANIKIVGYVDDDPEKQGLYFVGLPVLGTLGQLPQIVETYKIQDAVVALPLRAYEQLIKTCRMLQEMSVHVRVIPDLFALSFPSAALEGFGGIPVIDLGQPGLYGWQRFSKRAFDVIAAILGLLFFAPLFSIVAILIKLDSPGPVFFKQKRIGENGRPFEMHKFRSMRCDADPEIHKAYVQRLIKENVSLEDAKPMGQASLKMEQDPRITRVGRIIRKISIDELPQLFDVLRGDMSLVGPRPALPYEVDLYEEWHKRRLDVPPGLTGWWQVKGRNRVSFDEMIRMDLYYIENRSFWMDLKILFLTPWAALSGKGAG